MRLQEEQLELKSELKKTFNEQINQFESAPDELKKILSQVWDKLETSTPVDYDQNAILAIIEAFAHLRELSQEFEPEDLLTLLDLLLGQIIIKLK